jgi:hypothetical protein
MSRHQLIIIADLALKMLRVLMENVEAPAHYNSRSPTILPQEAPHPPNLEIPTRSTNVSHITSKTGSPMQKYSDLVWVAFALYTCQLPRV